MKNAERSRECAGNAGRNTGCAAALSGIGMIEGGAETCTTT